MSGFFCGLKANIDILEANKGSNKEEIKRLRAENKGLRLKLSQLVRGGAHGDEVIDKNRHNLLSMAYTSSRSLQTSGRTLQPSL